MLLSISTIISGVNQFLWKIYGGNRANKTEVYDGKGNSTRVSQIYL